MTPSDALRRYRFSPTKYLLVPSSRKDKKKIFFRKKAKASFEVLGEWDFPQRVFQESAAGLPVRRNFGDHLNAMALRQLPADSLSPWPREVAWVQLWSSLA